MSHAAPELMLYTFSVLQAQMCRKRYTVERPSGRLKRAELQKYYFCPSFSHNCFVTTFCFSLLCVKRCWSLWAYELTKIFESVLNVILTHSDDIFQWYTLHNSQMKFTPLELFRYSRSTDCQKLKRRVHGTESAGLAISFMYNSGLLFNDFGNSSKSLFNMKRQNGSIE